MYTFNLAIVKVFIISMLLIEHSKILCWNYDFEQVFSPTGENDVVVYNFRSTRMNRTTYAISGNATCKAKFRRNPEKYFMVTNIYHSSKGNNQYVKTPFRLPTATFCDFLNNHYKKFFMKGVHDATDGPYSDDKNADLCNDQFRSNEERTYFVNNLLIDKNLAPPFLPTGLYKIEIDIVFNDDVKSRLVIVVKVY